MPSNTHSSCTTREVSRHHAEIRRADNDYTISDLNSSNGTFVNGQRDQPATSGQRRPDSARQHADALHGPGRRDAGGPGRTSSASARRPIWRDRSRIVRSVTQEEGSRIFDLAAEAPQNSWLARARSNLQVMYRTALAVSHTLDIDQLLQRIMELIFEWVEADRGCIMLMDPTSKTLQPKVRRTRKGVRADERITISKTILDYVIERNEGVLTSDARQDDRWDAGGSIMQMGVREAICVPMQGRYDVVGAIYIDTSTSAQQLLRQGRRQQVHRRPPEADDRHRATRRRWPSRTPATTPPWSRPSGWPPSAKPSPRSRTTSRTFCRASAAAAT